MSSAEQADNRIAMRTAGVLLAAGIAVMGVVCANRFIGDQAPVDVPATAPAETPEPTSTPTATTSS